MHGFKMLHCNIKMRGSENVKFATGQLRPSQHFSFPLSVSFHLCSTLTFISQLKHNRTNSLYSQTSMRFQVSKDIWDKSTFGLVVSVFNVHYVQHSLISFSPQRPALIWTYSWYTTRCKLDLPCQRAGAISVKKERKFVIRKLCVFHKRHVKFSHIISAASGLSRHTNSDLLFPKTQQ